MNKLNYKHLVAV